MNYRNILFSFCFIIFSITTSVAQLDSVRMYIFGHSLLDHRPPLNPTPSDETTVPHWLHLLSEHDEVFYGATGQYGFLPQHVTLPPFSQWGYDIVPAVWDSELEPFSDADFNTVLLTAGNFIQWQGPDENYFGNDAAWTPISATDTIINWVDQQEEFINIYIYENWPDMAPYISGEGFPPTGVEFENYNNYTTGEFHDWWLEYQDSLLNSSPEINVRMIPVGPIMAQLFRDTLLTEIPILDLYEDNAPHGRPTLYFLAALITHMAIHNEIAAFDYNVPDIVHHLVEDNYEALVTYIWNELNAFNLTDGTSRVFYPEEPLPVILESLHAALIDHGVQLSWLTQSEENNAYFELLHAFDGIRFEPIGRVDSKADGLGTTAYSFIHQTTDIGKHYYQLKQVDFDGRYQLSPIITVEKNTPGKSLIFPNPAKDRIYLQGDFQQNQCYKIYSLAGQLVFQGNLSEAMSINVKPLNEGIWILKIENVNFRFVKL